MFHLMISTLDVVSFSTSNGLLIIIWIIVCTQLCTTKIKNVTRCCRICWVLVFNSLLIALNSLYYLSNWYPNYPLLYKSLTLTTFTIIFEGLTLIVGFHLVIQLQIWLINQLYVNVNKYLPKWIKIGYTLQKIIIILIIISGCALNIIFNEINYIYSSHSIIAFIVFIDSLIITFTIIKILNLIKNN
eukprot:451743_1